MGWVLIGWSRIEITLDAICGTAFHHCGGKQHFRKLPYSLTDKVEQFRTYHNELPQLSHRRAAAIALVDRVDALKGRRDDIVHGAAMELSADGAIRFMRLRTMGTYHDLTRPEITMEQVKEFAQNTANLSGDLMTYAKSFETEYWPNTV
mgnify:CR=1 FL=1